MGNLSSKRGAEQPNTTPTGLYDHCEWDPKVVRRLILEKKLAPISVGKVETSEDGLEECPICFLYYSGGLNRSRCCRKGACTECYLQVKRPNQNTTCPFCNHAQYIVTFSGPLSREEIAQEAQEQMKVLELKINMRKEEIERDKQRELEKERQRSERELTGATEAIATSARGTPNSSNSNSSSNLNFSNARLTPNTSSNPPVRATHSVPSQPPFGAFNSNVYGSSYPPPATTQHYNAFNGDGSGLADPDLDDLMLMEAIRLSLLDIQPSQEPAQVPVVGDSSTSRDHTGDGGEKTVSSMDTTTENTTPTSTPTIGSTTGSTTDSTTTTTTTSTTTIDSAVRDLPIEPTIEVIEPTNIIQLSGPNITATTPTIDDTDSSTTTTTTTTTTTFTDIFDHTDTNTYKVTTDTNILPYTNTTTDNSLTNPTNNTDSTTLTNTTTTTTEPSNILNDPTNTDVHNQEHPDFAGLLDSNNENFVNSNTLSPNNE